MAPERVETRVERDIDVVSLQIEARALASRVGFSRRDATEIAIVASELGTNALKYAGSGLVVIEALDDPERGRGVRVTAFDRGPPFKDFERALRDGSDEHGPIDPATFARRRGIGGGLGAVRRFSDACGWLPEPVGKRVWAERFLRRARPSRS